MDGPAVGDAGPKSAGVRRIVGILTDGLTGLVAEKDNRTLMLRGASDQTLRLPIDQIDTQQALPTSLMPQGLLDALTEQQTRDLFAYLRGTQPLNE